MKTTGLFTLHKYTIKVPAAGTPMRLVLWGDVHRDSPHHAEEAWQKFLTYARGLKNAWFLGLGDYLDSMSTSERDCLGKAAFHESTRFDLTRLANMKVDLLTKELGFMKGRLIGLLSGNHFFQYESGGNSDHRLCEKLECRCLGVSTFTRVVFEYRDATRIAFDIWAHHGKGAGRLPGGSINRVDQMREHADADLYIMGDDHYRAAVPANPRLTIEPGGNGGDHGLRLKARQQYLVRSGSFLRSYVDDGIPDYNVDAARGPRSIGHVELEITYRNTGSEGDRRHVLEVRTIT